MDPDFVVLSADNDAVNIDRFFIPDDQTAADPPAQFQFSIVDKTKPPFGNIDHLEIDFTDPEDGLFFRTTNLPGVLSFLL